MAAQAPDFSRDQTEHAKRPENENGKRKFPKWVPYAAGAALIGAIGLGYALWPSSKKPEPTPYDKVLKVDQILEDDRSGFEKGEFQGRNITLRAYHDANGNGISDDPEKYVIVITNQTKEFSESAKDVAQKLLDQGRSAQFVVRKDFNPTYRGDYLLRGQEAVPVVKEIINGEPVWFIHGDFINWLESTRTRVNQSGTSSVLDAPELKRRYPQSP